jgi:dTDP-4-amino-4,6-dideoxygalactose transaminase
VKPHFLASATAGLHLAVALLKHRHGWREGDEVVTTPLTFVSTNHVLLHERLRPVFADVDEHLCLDPKSVSERVTPRTRAVMFVGLAGNPGRLAEIQGLCASRGLRFILDAAHMCGSRIGDEHVGREADATVFSFHAVKNLPTADGGMVCFKDAGDDREVRKWSWMGISQDTYARTTGPAKGYRWRYDVEHVGFKYHGNSVMAALGLVALRHLEEDNAHRRRLAEAYERRLGGCAGVTTIPVPAGTVSSRHLLQILVENRDELMLDLNSRQIFPGVHYRDNTEYPMYAKDAHPCPRARSASDRIVSLPLHLNLGEAEVERVSDAVKEFVAGKR